MSETNVTKNSDGRKIEIGVLRRFKGIGHEAKAARYRRLPILSPTICSGLILLVWEV